MGTLKLILRCLGFTFLLLCLCLILFYFYRLPTVLDPQGEASDSCLVEEFPTIPNGHGMVVTGHSTYCDDVIHDAATYIYVHRVGEPADSGDLVLRYANDTTNGDQPKITWTDASHLSIDIGVINQITKIFRQRDGISIHYVIADQEYPPEDWRADQRRLEIYSVFVFLAGVGVIYLLIRMMRNATGEEKALSQ